jgi:hypothetical protein
MRFLVLGLVLMLIAATPTGKVAVDQHDETTDFLVDGEVIATYHHGRDIAKPHFASLFAPGHIPVTSGSLVPRRNASDTAHMSAWIGYGDVLADELSTTSNRRDSRGVDFWSSEPGHGLIACLNVSTVSIPGRAELRSANVWKTRDGRAMLDEERLIELYNLDKGRLLIITSTLKSAGLPVTLGDTSAGFLGVRVHEQIGHDARKKTTRGSKSQITNSAGESGESACWGKRADWCDYSGIVDGHTVGVAVFDDPANKPRACWQVRDSGLLAANPFGRGIKAGYPVFASQPEPLVRLTIGQSLTLRYAIYIHAGDVKSGEVADSYRKFLALMQ